VQVGDVEGELVGVVAGAAVLGVDDRERAPPAMPDASRSAENVFPLPVPPATRPAAARSPAWRA
jgi:hypothetical protein